MSKKIDGASIWIQTRDQQGFRSIAEELEQERGVARNKVQWLEFELRTRDISSTWLMEVCRDRTNQLDMVERMRRRRRRVRLAG